MTGHTKGTRVLKKLGVIAGGPIHHFTNGSGQSQLFMATGGEDMHHTEVEANAERAVLCWNEHDQLVADLKTMTDGFLILMAEYLSWNPNANHAPLEGWQPILLTHA